MDLHSTVTLLIEELYQTIQNELRRSFPRGANETQTGLVITELSRTPENEQLHEVHSETDGSNEIAVENSARFNLAIEDINLIEDEIKKLEDLIYNQSQHMEEEINHIKNRLSSIELGSKAILPSARTSPKIIDSPGTSTGILVSSNAIQHSGPTSDSHVRIITPTEMKISSESHKSNRISDEHQNNFATKRTSNTNLSIECSLDEGEISGNTDDPSGVRSISKSLTHAETSAEKEGILNSLITARASATVQTTSDFREPVRISTETDTDTIHENHETIPAISTGTATYPKSTSYSQSFARTGKLSSQSCTDVKSLDEGPVSEYSLSEQRSLAEGSVSENFLPGQRSLERPISEYTLSTGQSLDEGPVSEYTLSTGKSLDEGQVSEYTLSTGKSLDEGQVSENYFSGEVSLNEELIPDSTLHTGTSLDEGKITDNSVYSKTSSAIRSVSNISRSDGTLSKAESVSISCGYATSAAETGSTSSIPIYSEISAQMEAKSPILVNGTSKGVETIPKTLISPKSSSEKRTILKSKNGTDSKFKGTQEISRGKIISGPRVPTETDIEMDKISKPSEPPKILPGTVPYSADATAWPQSVDQMVHNYSNGNKLHILIDMTEYIPKEIYVDIIEDRLVVQARKSAEKRERSIEKGFNYHMYLPEGTRREHVKKFMTKDGILIIKGILPNIIKKQ